jgi:hypothetical protein
MDQFNTQMLRRPDTGQQAVQQQNVMAQQQQQNAMAAPAQQVVNEETVRKWNLLLTKYKAGKAHLDQRVIDAERWWKLRNEFNEEVRSDPKNDGFRSKSSWLHNVIVNKHADAIEAYPQPNILPREEGDKLTAWALTKIVPVVLKQNRFATTYDEVMWQKLKTGTGVYKVIWDASKLNGLGDINVTRRDILNLFWEPGIQHIQDSRMLFDVEMIEKDVLLEQYPQLEERRLSNFIIPVKQATDDPVQADSKVAVIDAYYKKNGRLHYCKYVGDQILYASENDPQRAETGLYEHGLYPYVFDALFPVEGSPAGYGYVDVCANSQMRVDLLGTAIIRNSMAGATPRYFMRQDGGVNEQEFLNIENTIVHTTGNLGEDAIRAIEYTGLSGNYINVLDQTINELRETSGNTETSTGSTSGGVTAASAIAALQEASGKGSRASIKASYECYAEVVNLVVELIRQFYDAPRQFRITGNMGIQRFMSFTNEGMQPQPQGLIGGMDMGFRVPLYDIDIIPEKNNAYTRLSNNELALQFFGMGFFNPQLTDQALMTLNMMDFDKKDEIMQQISANGTMAQMLAQWQQLALSLAQKYEPGLVSGLASSITGQPSAGGSGGAMMSQEDRENIELDKGPDKEPKNVQDARERANTASQPGGSAT